MYLVDTDIDLTNTPRAFRTKTAQPSRIIDAFQRTGKPIMEVVFTKHEYKNSLSCRSTFANAIRRMNVHHIHVITRNGRVYLINMLTGDFDDDES